MKEQNKTSERELNDEDIANISDGECKALAIKMLIDLIEVGQKIKKQMKDKQNKIKIFREPTVTRRKPGLKAMIWNKRKK